MSVKTASRAQEVPATAPLGAHHDGSGASFALFSSVADGVELCLFDDSGAETRWSLDQGDGFVWQGYLPDVHRASATAFGARPLGSVRGRPLQSREAAARPLCPRGRGRGALGPGGLRSCGR